MLDEPAPVEFQLTGNIEAPTLAVIGQTVATNLFTNGQSPVGQLIRVRNVPFTVIGVLSERGQGLDVGNDDDQIYVPLSTAMHRLMNVDYYGGIVVEIDRADQIGKRMDEASRRITTILRRRHHLRENQLDDFQVGNQKRLIDDRRAAASRLRTLVGSVAVSALVLSSGGIAGISLIAIKQRTREIGTRRALGATARHVFGQILFETATLAVLGAFAGVGIAYLGSEVIARQSQLPFSLNPVEALLAAGLAVALNLVFALLPARRAAALDPIEALRHE